MSKNTEETPQAFTLEDLENARREERDKLYGKINQTDDKFKTMQDELSNLRKFQKEQEKAEEKRQAEIEAARKAAEEEKLSAKELITQRNQEWEERFAVIQAQLEQERAIFAKEREFNELRNYVRERIAAESDNIAPELLDYIDGNTREDIDASIERAKAKTAAILEGLQAAQTAARAGMHGTGTGPSPITQDQIPSSQEISAEDIQGMDWKSFAKLRAARGMDRPGQGIFG